MHKQNSKEIARVDNDEIGNIFIDCLRLALNTARYKLKIRGRKPNKRQMKADHLPPNYYSKDGDIPRIHATELAIYLEGVEHDCDNCAVTKKCVGLTMELFNIRTKISGLDSDNTTTKQELAVALWEIREYEKEKIHLEDRVKLVFAQTNERERYIRNLKNKVELDRNRIKVRDNFINHIRKKTHSHRAEMLEQKSELKTANGRVVDRDNCIKNLREKLDTANGRVGVRDQHIEHVRRKVCSLKRELTTLNSTSEYNKDTAKYWSQRWDEQVSHIRKLCDILLKKDKYIAMLFYFGIKT